MVKCREGLLSTHPLKKKITYICVTANEGNSICLPLFRSIIIRYQLPKRGKKSIPVIKDVMEKNTTVSTLYTHAQTEFLTSHTVSIRTTFQLKSSACVDTLETIQCRKPLNKILAVQSAAMDVTKLIACIHVTSDFIKTML